MNANSVEQVFIDQFRQQGYTILPGSSLLDDGIPTSFVMSAGWVQVERAAQQMGILNSNLHGGRFVLIQNCFRHFDLDRIGEDETHLSFFRMAGAFTFEKARRSAHIQAMWKVLVDDFHLPPERLWVTYFAGDTVAGQYIPPDDETCRAYVAVGLPQERLIALGKQDNFWMQSTAMVGAAQSAKCGPNSEVFFDLGREYGCSGECRPGCGCGRFVELMNNLFISFQYVEAGNQIRPLAEPFIEAVIGVERVAMITQGKKTVFEIDALFPLLELARRFERASDLPNEEHLRHEYRLVDHLRSAFYLAADGAPPPNKHGARGYLMRRLTRRLFTSLMLLGIAPEDFLPAAIELLPAAYLQQPDQANQLRQKGLAYLMDCKAQFGQMVVRAQRMLDHELAGQLPSGRISGEQVLRLEKRGGIPIDLLECWLRDRQVTFDRPSYEIARATWQAQTVQPPTRVIG